MRLSIPASVIAVALASSAFAQSLPGPSSDKPFTENWAPSKWGAQDSAGSANHTKNPQNIQRALATVKQFKSLTVGKYYHRDIPSVGERKWSMVLPGTPHAGPFGNNAMSKGMFFYNGRMYPQSYERGGGGRAVGMGPLGVENVGELGFVCRLVVLDAVAFRKSQGRIPASAEMLPIPKQPGDPGNRHG